MVRREFVARKLQLIAEDLDLGAYSRKFAERIARSAGLRSILVHDYSRTQLTLAPTRAAVRQLAKRRALYPQADPGAAPVLRVSQRRRLPGRRLLEHLAPVRGRKSERGARPA